jgi:hypothetical protein
VHVPGFIHAHPVVSAAAGVALCAGILGTGIAVSAHTGAPMQTAEGSRITSTTVYTDAVDFYRGVCPSLLALRDGTDAFSRSVEDGVGEDDGIRIPALSATLNALADGAEASVPGVERLVLPTDVPVPGSTDTADYTDAQDSVLRVLSDQSGKLRAAATASGEDPEKTMADAVSAAAGAAGDVLGSLSTDAPLPPNNAPTRDAVLDSPECTPLGEESVVPDDVVHQPYVDLRRVLGDAHAGWTDAVDRFAGREGVDANEITTELSAAAGAAADSVDTRLTGNPDDPVVSDLDAARDAVDTYRLLAAPDADARPQDLVNTEARLTVRLGRVAVPPNQVTAEAVHG